MYEVAAYYLSPQREQLPS